MPAIPHPDPARPICLVTPFYATDHGSCLCGPYLPMSVVRLGPDTPPSPARAAITNGYRSDQPIRCFSHTHVSGTGGQGRYGNVGVMPFLGAPLPDRRVYPIEDEHASVGYYRVRLGDTGIAAELTSTHGTGAHRYTFPADGPGNVMIDLATCIGGRNVGGKIDLMAADEIVGRGDYVGGWGHEHEYSVYFFAKFETLPNNAAVYHHTHPQAASAASGESLCCVAHFTPGAIVELRVGISYRSIADARAHYEEEAAGVAFDDLVERARRAWASIFDKLKVEGGTETQKTLFYSNLYRLYCMPSDLGVDRDFPGWRSGVRHFTDFYCFWDSVRCANSMFALIDPHRHADMLNCVLDIADHRGRLPDSWIAGHYGRSQGGATVGNVFTESALKGIDGIDYDKALRYMRRDAEVPSEDPHRVGRYLDDYRKLGYVSTEVPKGGASRHVEYSYQDWCIARLAEHLGDRETAEDYDRAAERYWNLYRDELQSIAPRHPDGGWVTPFDPIEPTSWRSSQWGAPGTNRHFYEGSADAWTFGALHAIPALIKRMGGDEAFCRKLDRILDNDFWWKEITLHLPWLYTCAGRVDRTCERVRESLELHYDPGRTGLEDDEDMGCMSGYYLFASMGLFPVVGQDLYLLAAPVFERSRIRVGSDDQQLIIEAPGASEANRYLVRVELNGRRLDRGWLKHREIVGGGTLELTLSTEPRRFASAPRPPLSRTEGG